MQDVPYHNSVHAADVTQSTHVLLNSPALEVRQGGRSRGRGRGERRHETEGRRQKEGGRG